MLRILYSRGSFTVVDHLRFFMFCKVSPLRLVYTLLYQGCGQSHFEHLFCVSWMEVKFGFWDPQKVSLSLEKRCPLKRGNNYSGYVNILPGPNIVTPEWRCPFNRGVPKERFHCITDLHAKHLNTKPVWIWLAECSQKGFFKYIWKSLRNTVKACGEFSLTMQCNCHPFL